LLVLNGKAEMIEDGKGFIHSASDAIPIPSVIRLGYYVNRPPARRRFTRLGVFHRDNFTCQYCGKKTPQLTIDHVVPRHMNGCHCWENVVSACIPCNHHKAGQLPKQAGMKLINEPAPPRERYSFYIPRQYQKNIAEWRKYLDGYCPS
jgi:5-methylcytosine-specific restriction endonuclease McrA